MKRTQKLVTWGIVILVVLVVLLMLVSNLRRSSRVSCRTPIPVPRAAETCLRRAAP